MTGALVEAAERLEVVREPLAQVDGLADVQDAAGGIREPVDPRRRRDLPGWKPCQALRLVL